MDYLTIAVDDGVVNNPLISSLVRELVQLPLPVWPLSIGHDVSPIQNKSGRIKRVFYDKEVAVAHDLSPEVSFYIPIKTTSFDFAVILEIKPLWGTFWMS